MDMLFINQVCFYSEEIYELFRYISIKQQSVFLDIIILGILFGNFIRTCVCIDNRRKKINILVAVDLSSASQKILHYVKTLALGLSAKVQLLYVEKLDLGFVGFGPGRPQSALDKVAEKFEKNIKNYKRRCFIALFLIINKSVE